jgi:protease I
MPQIAQSHLLILATDGFDHAELLRPRDELAAKGAQICIAAPCETRRPGFIRSWRDDEWGTYLACDTTLDRVNIRHFDGLILPGGPMNPDRLRAIPTAVDIVRGFYDAGKIIAAICHAPHVLVEAGIVSGRCLTSWPSIRTDLMNAGAQWRDQDVVTDKGLITSRSPKDLDAFIAKIVEEIEEGDHLERHAEAA